MFHRCRGFALACVGALIAGALAVGPAGAGDAGPAGPPATGGPVRVPGLAGVPMGAFLGSGPEGVARMNGLRAWLGGTQPRVGRTYLPGDLWSNIEGQPPFLRAWADWRRAGHDRLFVLNVPMQERNEAGVPDEEVRELLGQGARGDFDHHFRTLAERLVALGVPDTVLVLGWEMNGVTYTHRCAPDPTAWKTYWKRIVTTMRAVPGQKFRFDFAPSRGQDAIGWTECYPGDDVVDIIGMDSYDQPPGHTFDDHIHQPFGLKAQVEFAARHGKPTSYPEWGLFRNGDNPEYMRRMLEWIRAHPPLYHTITDYCPHGVWQCRHRNPDSARVFRASLSSLPSAPPPRPEHPPFREPRCWFRLDLGDWIGAWIGHRTICVRFSLRD
ncbi:glycoside hydrolase family 26 protein [Streptomyces sp. URMC 123]|uniref:glycoside hydrolase family 26 protein n=1 Tax=Streptomyces sp. URMC 123 TaxID=3423403 RepID=UPI003F19F08C